MKKKCFVLLFFITFTTVQIFSQNAKVTFTKGKVEVLRQDAWKPLNVGDLLQESDVVSTGFQSEMKINYKGTIISLGALTRITFEELQSSDTKESVSVFLNTGAVRTKVNHSSGKRVAHSVKTPVAVASVRGTDFLVTGNGNVSCFEGAVAVYPNFEYRNKNSVKEETKITDEDEENSEESDEIIESYTSATSTTPAKEIFEASPAETVVIGKNKSISIVSTSGRPESSMKSSVNQIYQAVTSVSTAAETDKVQSAVSTVINTINNTQTENFNNISNKGSLSVNVEIKE